MMRSLSGDDQYEIVPLGQLVMMEGSLTIITDRVSELLHIYCITHPETGLSSSTRRLLASTSSSLSLSLIDLLIEQLPLDTVQ